MKKKKAGEVDILFVNKDCQSKGMGTSTRMTIEKMFPKI